ncbi:dna topoisomerase, partial [Nannochloropsis gaditana]
MNDRLRVPFRPSGRKCGGVLMAPPAVACPECRSPCAWRITKKDGPNKGRGFWVCTNAGICGKFFRWANPGESAPPSSPTGRLPFTSASSPEGATPSNGNGGNTSTSYFLKRLEHGNRLPGGGFKNGVASSQDALSPSRAQASSTDLAVAKPSAFHTFPVNPSAYGERTPTPALNKPTGMTVEFKLHALQPVPTLALAHPYSDRLVTAYKEKIPEARS